MPNLPPSEARGGGGPPATPRPTNWPRLAAPPAFAAAKASAKRCQPIAAARASSLAALHSAVVVEIGAGDDVRDRIVGTHRIGKIDSEVSRGHPSILTVAPFDNVMVRSASRVAAPSKMKAVIRLSYLDASCPCLVEDSGLRSDRAHKDHSHGCPSSTTRICVAFSALSVNTSSTCSPLGSWCAMKMIVTLPLSWFTVC